MTCFMQLANFVKSIKIAPSYPPEKPPIFITFYKLKNLGFALCNWRTLKFRAHFTCSSANRAQNRHASHVMKFTISLVASCGKVPFWPLPSRSSEPNGKMTITPMCRPLFDTLLKSGQINYFWGTFLRH